MWLEPAFALLPPQLHQVGKTQTLRRTSINCVPSSAGIFDLTQLSCKVVHRGTVHAQVNHLYVAARWQNIRTLSAPCPSSSALTLSIDMLIPPHPAATHAYAGSREVAQVISYCSGVQA